MQAARRRYDVQHRRRECARSSATACVGYRVASVFTPIVQNVQDNKMEASRCFQATIPGNLPETALESIKKWGRESCDAISVETCNEMTAIIVIRRLPKTTREFQRLVSTNCKHWGIKLPPRKAGWLSLLSEEDAAVALRQGPACATETDPSSPEPLPPPAPHIPERDNVIPEATEIRVTTRSEYRPCLLRLPVNLLTSHRRCG